MPPGVHSNLGASKASRWMACPGSVRLEKDQPNRSSEHAIEGSAAHAVAERALLENLSAHDFVDEVIETDKGDLVVVTEEMAEAAQVYVDFVQDAHNAAGAGARLFIEQEFDLAPLNPPAPMFGTSDAAIWCPRTRHLHVIDYKHGKGVVVEAAGNPQLRYYALGAVVALHVKPRTVTITVVQPRAHHPDGPIRSEQMGFGDLAEFKSELFAAAHATEEPDAPLVVGDHCRFCKAQAICPAQRSHAIEVAQTEFDVVDTVTLPAPDTLTVEQITKALAASAVIEDWFRAIRAHVTTLLEFGHDVPGWKLVEKRANRKWQDEEEAAAFLTEHVGDDAYVRSIVSPAQAEKLLRQVKRGLASEIEPLVVRKSSGLTLAPDTDTRPAVVAGADEFAALPSPQNS